MKKSNVITYKISFWTDRQREGFLFCIVNVGGGCLFGLVVYFLSGKNVISVI